MHDLVLKPMVTCGTPSSNKKRTDYVYMHTYKHMVIVFETMVTCGTPSSNKKQTDYVYMHTYKHMVIVFETIVTCGIPISNIDTVCIYIYIYPRGLGFSDGDRWGGVGWGGVGISTSWRPRPWYYVVSIYARLRMQHVTTLTLRWGGVGWGGDINVLTTTSLIVRCQHICSLEDATCHYVDTSLGWGGVGWGGVGWWYQRPDDHVLDTTLSAYILAWGCNMSLRWHFVGWGGVGWWYQRPDDHVLDTTLSAYMLAWGCNMSLRYFGPLGIYKQIIYMYIFIYTYPHI